MQYFIIDLSKENEISRMEKELSLCCYEQTLQKITLWLNEIFNVIECHRFIKESVPKVANNHKNLLTCGC